VRYLYYTNYQSGRSGLSNGIMSVEAGVILAHLTNRLLVLAGNVAPPANIVAYDDRVDNRQPSRVTDLIDIPVPWVEPSNVDVDGLESLELTDLALTQAAFYFPKTLDLSTPDAQSFARGRDHWVTVAGEHERVPVLRLSEEPLVRGTEYHRTNLCFYSYLFYLDDETRRSVYRVLERMVAKPPFLELAAHVARDIGSFNAVHLRRGDFKVTYGVTTLDRQAWEAIDAMDQVFRREEPLVILTDERDAPFFREIKRAYPDHYFIDWHILDHYGEEFAQLPCRDSLSLAHLSQLVAAESQDFIGTMTSTFTALIQRYRGNRRKQEVFRFLWNELPEPGQAIERGRHAITDCIPLERGVMIEELDGPYSWNRVSQLLNPAWMREWPESFLTPETLATGALPKQESSESEAVSLRDADAMRSSILYVFFENFQVGIRCRNAGLLQRLAPELGAKPDTRARNVIAELEVNSAGTRYRIQRRGKSPGKPCNEAEMGHLVRLEIVEIFAQARKGYTWLIGGGLARDGHALVISGDTSGSDASLLEGLREDGWILLGSGVIAIRAKDLMVVPFGARSLPEGAAAQTGRIPTPLENLVMAARAPLHSGNDRLTPVSPAAAVAELIGASLDFKLERSCAVERLCGLVERRPVARLYWNNPHQAARVIRRGAGASSPTVA
jgi:hypothetical protein